MRRIPRAALIGVLSAAATTAAFAQKQQALPSAALARADSAFGRSMWQAAADGLQVVVRESPANGMAWLRLGTSLDQLGKSDDAIAAFNHAVAIGFQPAVAEFRTARVCKERQQRRGVGSSSQSRCARRQSFNARQ